MNWYKIAQSNIQIEKENLPDRIHIFLTNNGKKVGKLTLQIFDFDKDNYYLTSFKIEPDYRNQGWGKKMMQELLNDPRTQDKSILVKPDPYSLENYKQEIDNLKGMYKHFGFEDYPENDYYMRFKRNK